MATDTEAVEALTELGLTEYEARCLVALSQLSEGTAKEISDVAEVPQSRVYDVTEQLHQRGLVDIEESDPRRYFTLPVERAIERLRREYSDRLDTASGALESLEDRNRDDDGAWVIAAREDVRNRIEMHVGDAEEEVYFAVAHEALLDGSVLDALAEAGERGVAVHVEVSTEALRDGVHDRAPAAGVALSDLPLDALATDERAPGRLLLVDRETVLLSARKEGQDPGDVDETGLWGSEVGHGLVAWLRPLLVARIERLTFQTAE